MCVHVNPTWRDQQSVGIDLAMCRTLLAAHSGDAAACDCNIAAEGRLAAAVNDRAAANDDVVHGSLPGIEKPMMRPREAENNGPQKAVERSKRNDSILTTNKTRTPFDSHDGTY